MNKNKKTKKQKNKTKNIKYKKQNKNGLNVQKNKTLFDKQNLYVVNNITNVGNQGSSTTPPFNKIFRKVGLNTRNQYCYKKENIYNVIYVLFFHITMQKII